MKFITSLSVERMNREASPLWPQGVTRLVVVVGQPDPRVDVLLALAIDPDHGHGHGHGHVVFEAELSPARLGSFIKTIIDGNRGEIDHHCHRIALPAPDYHVSDPKHLVRKAALALATAIHSDETLAEAVVNPSPHRHPPHKPGKGDDY